VNLADFNRSGVAGSQEFVLTPVSGTPHRTDGMDHMPRRQSIRVGDFGATGFAAAERAAFGQQLGSSCTVDRAIDTPSAKQGGVRRVDDGINAQRRDVGDDDFQPRRTDLARRQSQGLKLRPRQPR